ncbi:hypothetical protein [Kitasatospora kazusensis]
MLREAAPLHQWEFDYADAGGHMAVARQYVLEFASVSAALEGELTFSTVAGCTMSGDDWVMDAWTPSVAAVRTAGARPLVEEITARVFGTRVAVLVVRRDDGGAGVGLHDEFRVAAGELAGIVPS